MFAGWAKRQRHRAEEEEEAGLSEIGRLLVAGEGFVRFSMFATKLNSIPSRQDLPSDFDSPVNPPWCHETVLDGEAS